MDSNQTSMHLITHPITTLLGASQRVAVQLFFNWTKVASQTKKFKLLNTDFGIPSQYAIYGAGSCVFQLPDSILLYLKHKQTDL